MTQILELEPGDKILEIGAQSGCQAIVFSHIIPTVYSIEINEVLVSRARKDIENLGYTNIEVKITDGNYGWEEYGVLKIRNWRSIQPQRKLTPVISKALIDSRNFCRMVVLENYMVCSWKSEMGSYRFLLGKWKNYNMIIGNLRKAVLKIVIQSQ